MNKIIATGLSIAVTIALVAGLILPKYRSLRGGQAEAEAKQQEVQNKKKYYQSVANASKELEKYAESVSKINSALPEEVPVPTIFDFFQKKASESGLTLKGLGQFAGTPLSNNQKIKVYNLSMELAGSLSNFKNFLSVLEKSARIIEVEKISFSSPSSEKEKDPLFNFSMGAKFYSY